MPRLPRLIEPAEEMELGREIRPAADHGLDRARRLRDRDPVPHLVQAVGIAETAASTSDHGVETGALLLHAERLDERRCLGADAFRVLERATEHQEPGLG